jgi:uncharacterized membrane protein YdbT with pleckstrin-like domain
MGYIDQNLISGETVTYRARLHWTLFVKPALFSLVMAGVAGLLLYLYVNGRILDSSGVLRWIVGGMLAIAAIPLIATAISRSSAEFAVTNKRVVLKTGFIKKKTAEMFLNKIESVAVDQTIPGRMFGYGTIVIRGTGGSLEPFGGVSAPLEFRRQIQEQIGISFEPPPKKIVP